MFNYSLFFMRNNEILISIRTPPQNGYPFLCVVCFDYKDMAGFTAYSSKITPTQLVRFLNRMYSAFDEITNKHGVYKVEVIGDAYFVVGGCPKSDPAHAHRIALTAIDFLKTLPGLREIAGADINIRIGIHTGSVIAGVVGEKDPRFGREFLSLLISFVFLLLHFLVLCLLFYELNADIIYLANLY